MSDAPVPPALHSHLPADLSPLVERHFVPDGSDPFDGFDWKARRSMLKDVTGTVSDKGKVIVPAGWSDNASDVLAQKYFRRAGVPSETEVVPEDGMAEGLSRSVPAPGSSFGGETDLRAVARRMSGCWAYWGMKSGLLCEEEAKSLADETSWLLVHQAFAPNSPQWFNTGLHWAYGIEGSGEGHHYVDPATGEVVETTISYERPQPQACFIQSVTDDLVNDGGIMDLWVREARLFKYGSGTGTNFSSVRAKGEQLSGGGLSSGLMSWLRIGDRSAAGIQSGGTTRRAAKMVVLDVDHPEIEDFVNWKPVEEQKVAAMVTGSRVNRKVVRAIRAAIEEYQSSNCVDDADRYETSKNRALRAALAEGRSFGVPDRLMVKAIESSKNHVVFDPEVYGLDWQGPAYDTVSGQQSNNSISIPDSFMESALSDGPWSLVERTTGKVRKTLRAAGLFDQICTAAWGCADPGLQFVDTMNDWHTCAADGKIRGTNPCAEYVFLDETACNLASLNLVQFLRGTSFDLVSYERAVRHATTVLEISVAMASLPSKAIAKGTYDYRTLGLGYANLGALLMRMGISYDSDEGRRVASAISSFTTATAYDQSGRMARRVGPFRRWGANKDSMNRVLANHRAVSRGEEADVRIQPVRPDLSVEDRATALFAAANEMWDRAVSHSEIGYRNAQVTCIAPTGTIALVMDCDTTGIEPDFSLVKHKTLAGGGFMKIVNQSVPSALRALGYNADQVSAVTRHIVGAGKLRPEDRVRLEKRGVSADAIGRIEGALKSAVHLRMAMLPDIVGREELARLQIDPSSPIPEALGFDPQVLEAASVHATGHQTVEGCSVVKPEHLAVFDCANRCGKGVRFIRGEGHLRMLSAIQPFLSGASSKTVNLPAGATVDEVRDTYVSAWKSGVKCVALYVDGSKFSQPLSSVVADQLFGGIDTSAPVGSPESAEVVQQVVEKIVEKVVEREKVLVRYLSERRRLPNRRRGMTQKVTIGNHKVFLRTGEYDDGSIGEIFIDTHKDGTSFRAMMGAFAIAVSVGLQHGVPLERFVDLFTFTKFEPNGVVSGDDRLYMCTSLLDWIFRHLAVHYLGREDLATNPSPTAYDPSTVGDGEPKYDGERTLLDRSVVLGSTVDTSPGLVRSPFATVVSLPTTFDPTLSAADLSTDEVLLTRSLSPSVGSVEAFGGMQTVSSGAVDMGFEGDWCERCGGFSMVRIGRCLRCRNPDCGAESGGCG